MSAGSQRQILPPQIPQNNLVGTWPPRSSVGKPRAFCRALKDGPVENAKSNDRIDHKECEALLETERIRANKYEEESQTQTQELEWNAEIKDKFAECEALLETERVRANDATSKMNSRPRSKYWNFFLPATQKSRSV
jgi:hypothetical protein